MSDRVVPLREPMYAGKAFDGRTATAAEAHALATGFLDQARQSGVPGPLAAQGAVWFVVSELMANAGRHAAGPCVLELELSGRVLEISVWDTAPTLREPMDSANAPSRKRGLEVIRELCLAVAVERSAGGKRIRARVPLS
ncbi:ATP-binding protein [Streptomyces sp. NPDC020607]|uniref:ATP-binding protein n=1 Tax=Streptomyces sp. NPDC020607 TaxID=3365082 RepID=UPI0037A59AB4